MGLSQAVEKESRVALEEIALRWQRWEIDEAGLQRVHMSNVGGYSKVAVRITRAG